MPFCETPGGTLYYEFDADAAKPVLVLSNSLGTNLSMWWPQVSAFQQHFSLLRYDSRGHGRSSVPTGPYTIAQMGQDLVALLDALSLDAVYFCGLSMGGMVGQWIGVHASERLKRLVLSNTAAKIGTPEGWNARIAAVRESGMQAVAPSILERWYTEKFRREHPAEVKRTGEMLESADNEGYVASCAAVRDMDQRADVSAIEAATLIVYGTYDVVTPAKEADFLVQQIAGAKALELDAAHLANIEAAADFSTGVLNFLRG